jgi:hypothetical protein
MLHSQSVLRELFPNSPGNELLGFLLDELGVLNLPHVADVPRVVDEFLGVDLLASEPDIFGVDDDAYIP